MEVEVQSVPNLEGRGLKGMPLAYPLISSCIFSPTVSALVAHMLKSGILELFLKLYHTKSSQRRLQERFAIFPIKIVH